MPAALQRLIEERAVAQLVEQTGHMLRLGSENGVPKLDWVLGIARLLEHEGWIEQVELEAAQLLEGGTRHIIWAGMGGSVMIVRVLVEMGFWGDASSALHVHVLDSTDPAALNAVLQAIADSKKLQIDRPTWDASADALHDLLRDVVMIGVSMGLTSEEPITHLEWFIELLGRAKRPVERHCLVMTLPGSYLERFALDRGVPSRPLQLDGGTGTGGRMSAPTTRVFLLPAAFALLTHASDRGQLRSVLAAAWAGFDLEGARLHPGDHPFVRLAARLSDTAVDGACRLELRSDREWSGFTSWIEQLMEESLGKDRQGVMIFTPAVLNEDARCYRADGVVRVQLGDHVSNERGCFAPGPTMSSRSVTARLAALAEACLGWQFTMALYGYLHDTPFAGQPAVEGYKTRARELRTRLDPLTSVVESGCAVAEGTSTLLAPPLSLTAGTPAEVLAHALRSECPSYLDLTVNGELPEESRAPLQAELEYLGHTVLGTPVKLRRAPAAYHSTEQSEMDGPPGVFSLRVIARRQEPILVGQYDGVFLAAQAVGTWQAMVEVDRACYLLIVDATPAACARTVATLLSRVSALLSD